jgi:spermidine synthase
MSVLCTEQDNFILHEMLTHPPLFSHQHATDVAILTGEHIGLAGEILKHSSVKSLCLISTKHCPIDNRRVEQFTGTNSQWLEEAAPNSKDIIIVPGDIAPTAVIYAGILRSLRPDGLLVQQGDSYFIPHYLQSMHTLLRETGFADVRVLHFPQPHAATGLRSMIMAIKSGRFKLVREKDIFNKSFTTRYYNYDVHKAAEVMPEFARHELPV